MKSEKRNTNENFIRTQFKKGHKLKEETIIKMKQARLGVAPWNKGKKGYKVNKSQEALIKMSNMMKENKLRTGLTPWNYIDGKSDKRERNYIIINRKRITNSHFIWCKENNMLRIPTGCVIHHRDLNPMNDNPNNLILLPNKIHSSAHNQFNKMLRGLN